MSEVFIKYNPYKLETEITVDGKKLAENSKLREASIDGSRLQEWVEDLPQLLIDEYNDVNFNITFHGTLLDFEDISSVFAEARNHDILTANLISIPAKETGDKEVLIDEIFEAIQQGPFEALNAPDITKAFQLAKSSDFDICVVATMSAGKSTLINAMLGKKLMPSKQEACTAIITCIKDTDVGDVPFRAEVFNSNGDLVETIENLDYPTMERLNSDENVSNIQVSGNIPFVQSDDVSLVLIDTPGPNNSRDPKHKEVQNEFLGKSSKAVVLYIITPEFGTTDDNNLLKDVAESMTVGGKQSKDRFIFVVNKFDTRNQEDGDIKGTMDRIRSYLKNHGITNPNLFPVAALPALNIRLINSGTFIDEDSKEETEMKVRKLNRNEPLHLENYASLPQSIRREIISNLNKANMEWEIQGGDILKNPNSALIHTGVISVEAAIRQYVQKYAKTAKIKNIVDTFNHKLNEIQVFKKLEDEIINNKSKHKDISNQICEIRKKMDSVIEAQNFEKVVNEAVLITNKNTKVAADKVIQKFLTKMIDFNMEGMEQGELEIAAAEGYINQLEALIKDLEPKFQSELQTVIQKNLTETGKVLIEDYKSKLVSLKDEIDPESIKVIEIDPFTLMESCVSSINISINELVHEKEVEDGNEWISNTDKKWFKPWTWFQEEGYFRKKYRKGQFIRGDQLTQEFYSPVDDHMYENGISACEYALSQSQKIATRFKEEFKQLDCKLNEKLRELENWTKEQNNTEERIAKCKADLNWLENIQEEVQKILEI